MASEQSESETWKYVYHGMIGDRDTRHEAVADLAKHGDWEPGKVTAITENCLVDGAYSPIVGPTHLGDKYYNDRQYYPTKHGAVRIKREELVRFVDNTRQEVVETEWIAECPICNRKIRVQGAGDAARSDLVDQILDHCGTEWFPPSDWVEDCDICGGDHRGQYNCKPVAFRNPFPDLEKDFGCARCGWDGGGEDLNGPNGECPHCDSPAVLVVEA